MRFAGRASEAWASASAMIGDRQVNLTAGASLTYCVVTITPVTLYRDRDPGARATATRNQLQIYSRAPPGRPGLHQGTKKGEWVRKGPRRNARRRGTGGERGAGSDRRGRGLTTSCQRTTPRVPSVGARGKGCPDSCAVVRSKSDADIMCRISQAFAFDGSST